jgi:hypothetical protein
MNIKNQNWVIYTNPNNTTNTAYLAIGKQATDVKKDAKQYEGSCKIISQGKGNKSLQLSKDNLINYKLIESL